MALDFGCTGCVLSYFAALYAAWFLIRNVYLYIIPRDQRSRLRSLGQWAVVTGSSDGIGEQYALQLAQLGLNIVLIARSQDKLQRVADQIKRESSGVQTRIVVVDFTKADIYEKIEREIGDLDIGVLINNVGMSTTSKETPRLGDKQLQNLQDLIVCNCISVTGMSSIVLPRMQAKGRGLIVNISSGSGMMPLPFMASYGASKSFETYLSESMRIEYAEFGVQVQTAIPFFIATKLSRKEVSYFVRTTESFVRAHINTFGVASFVHGCFQHEVQGVFIRLLSCLPFRDLFVSRVVRKLRKFD